MLTASDFRIKCLGTPEVSSPLLQTMDKARYDHAYVKDAESILLDDNAANVKAALAAGREVPSLEIAGPRDLIFHDPKSTKAAIVTCGGLCPGLNDVIRGVVMELYYRYGVKSIFGIPYGYQGFIDRYNHEIIPLSPEKVAGIHKSGGTILGSSRGQQDVTEMVDFLAQRSINVLFVIGGDGTQRGAREISQEAERRGLPISVVGVPKTIDNDIMYVDQSFGFETAFSKAVEAISVAHNEAKGYPNGIGLIKLMGRHSGFIACHAALAMSDVNAVLIPEVPFALEGEGGFLPWLEERLAMRKHAVIVVAEGAGQDLIAGQQGVDESGNKALDDVGLFMKSKIAGYLKQRELPFSMKYIDPSYIIRSVPRFAERQ